MNKNKRSYKKRVNLPSEILLPEIIISQLEEKLLLEPPIFKYEKEIALFFLSVIFNRTVQIWEHSSMDDYALLNSEKLRPYASNYNNYFDYFIETKLVEMLPHRRFATIKQSRRYRFSSLIRGVLNGDFLFKFSSVQLSVGKRGSVALCSRNQISQDVMMQAHLSKWFNENLTINYNSAKGFMESQGNLGSSTIFSLSSIENLHHQNFYAKRNLQTDRRIHTNLTNLNKRLRHFLRYDGETLVNYDIKSSQPFFFVHLVEKLIENPQNFPNMVLNGVSKISKTESRLSRVEKYGYILQNLNQVLYSSAFALEWDSFKKMVLTDDIYTELDDVLIPKEMENNYLITGFGLKNSLWERKKLIEYVDHLGVAKTKKKSSFYENKRDVVKVILLNIFYGGIEQPCAEYKFFSKKFPQVCSLLKILKTFNTKSIAIWLQQTEANCIIENVTKRIAGLHPEMPIFTIHDSIMTTESWSEKVDMERIIEMAIFEDTGLKPEIKIEKFNSKTTN